MEIENLPKEEFMVLILKLIKEIRKYIDAQSNKLEVFNKELKRKKKKTVKKHKHLEANNMLLNNQWIPEEIKQEIKNYVEKIENELTMIKIYGMQQK